MLIYDLDASERSKFNLLNRKIDVVDLKSENIRNDLKKNSDNPFYLPYPRSYS